MICPSGLAIGKVAPRHRLVDHARARRLLRVALVEEPSGDQRNLHRLEVAGHDDADVRERIFAAWRRLAFDVERQRHGLAHIGHRQHRDGRGAGHAGRHAQPARRRPRRTARGSVDRDTWSSAAAPARRRDCSTRTPDHLQQLGETAGHQPGADEQHQCQRDLDDHQSAEHMPGVRAARRACRLGEVAAQVCARRVQRRNHAKGERHGERDRRRKEAARRRRAQSDRCAADARRAASSARAAPRPRRSAPAPRPRARAAGSRR